MFTSLDLAAVRIAGLDWPQAIDLAQRHGFEGIEPLVHDQAVRADPAAARARLQAAGLRCGGFGLPVQFRGDEAAFQEGLADLAETARVAQALGSTRCVTYILPFHDELPYQANFELHARRLGLIAEILAEHGIRLGVELVGPRTLRQGHKHEFVHTLDQILELAGAIGSNAGLLLDCFHWHCVRGSVSDITSRLAGRVVYVHVNDARPGRSPEEQIDNQRALPCATGVIDARGFMQALRAIGYDGPVVAEPFLAFEGQGPEEIAAQVAASLRQMMGL